ncbi:hypothetical protein BVRB_013790 [Beta vulgaris subsp. vulgaris]|uniref:Uncharacterized protein n=1 Tax=Beta vulgaris subsp. vulgaris TaxID=3555 RepID=A0A0J8B1P8_BETVV|nr:hypothetical protein BVRB_013790 [Beta vulgaris subsp. vulgaris]
MLAYPSGLEASQEAMTEYRVLGPMINGCSWIELRPLTSWKHQYLGAYFMLCEVADSLLFWCKFRFWMVFQSKYDNTYWINVPYDFCIAWISK